MSHDLDAWLEHHEQERAKQWNWLCNRATPVLSRPPLLDRDEPALLKALRRVFSAQKGSSDCSLTSVTILLDALVPAGSPHSRDEVLALANKPREHEPPTPTATAETIWRAATGPDGPGVTFAELRDYATAVFGRHGFDVSDRTPNNDAEGANELRADLRALSPDAAVLLYLDQGVFTGDRGVLHVTPVGAYDEARDRVLILEVDPALPAMYLAPLAAVMEALTRQVDDPNNRLRGQRGGWLRISRRP